jgi:hypothetical protein
VLPNKPIKLSITFDGHGLLTIRHADSSPIVLLLPKNPPICLSYPPDSIESPER